MFHGLISVDLDSPDRVTPLFLCCKGILPVSERHFNMAGPCRFHRGFCVRSIWICQELKSVFIMHGLEILFLRCIRCHLQCSLAFDPPMHIVRVALEFKSRVFLNRAIDQIQSDAMITARRQCFFVCTGVRLLSDDEEGRFHIVLFQHRQRVLHDRIAAVIKCDQDTLLRKFDLASVPIVEFLCADGSVFVLVQPLHLFPEHGHGDKQTAVLAFDFLLFFITNDSVIRDNRYFRGVFAFVTL